MEIAYRDVDEAYHEARIGVYDRFPAGPLDTTLLEDWQLVLVADHELAEVDLDLLRHNRRRRGPEMQQAE